MKNTLRKKIIWSALAVPALMCVPPTAIWAKAAPTTGASSAGATDAPDTQPGLDALIKNSETKVLTELVNDGLDTLLQRQFDVDNIAPEQRKAIESLKALRLLNDRNAKLGGQQRLNLVEQAANGLQAAKANLPRDPATLQQYAQVLIPGGLEYYRGILEYWGENPLTQAHFKPIADTVCDLFQMASDAASAQCIAKAAANQMLAAHNLDNESHYYKYCATVLQYDRALAIDASDPAGKSSRQQICDDAINNLQMYDNARSHVQSIVELNMAKNLALEGKFSDADKMFGRLFTPGVVTPAPVPDLLNDAYYFRAVTKLKAGDSAGTKKIVADMMAYQQTLPGLLANAHWHQANIDDFMKSVDSNNQLLQYRIDMLDASQAQNPAAKNQLNQAAAKVLVDLGKKRPDLQHLIYEQLVNTLPPSQSVKTMDTLLLRAVISKAINEVATHKDKPDKAILQRGLDAAKELLTRNDPDAITPQIVEATAKLVPAWEAALGQNLDAANSYLDLVEKYKATYLNETDPKVQKAKHDEADSMLQWAYGLMEGVRTSDPKAPGLMGIYERFYAFAVAPPFNHSVFDYYYGEMLKDHKKLPEAAELFKKVPTSDDNYAEARWDLLGVDNKLVEAPNQNSNAHEALVADTVEVATEIRNHLAHETKPGERYRAAVATLTLADLALNDQNNPQTALKLLDNYENAVAGLDQLNAGTPHADSIEKYLMGKCHFLRYPAHMKLNQTDQATADLLAIMNGASGDEGARMVHEQLDDLQNQFNKVQAAGKPDQMLDIARNQAKLSSVLADWSHNNKNPANAKSYYYFGVTDAQDQRIAGSLEENSAAKQKDLNEALKKYTYFLSKEGHALYLDQLDPAKKNDPNFDPTAPDPIVELGLAETQFELHNYLEAQKSLSYLLANGLLGSNSSDLAWEAKYELFVCNFELARQGNPDAVKSLEDVKNGLKQLYIFGGIPPQLQGSFDALCKKEIPDWKLPEPTTEPTLLIGTGPSTTQPDTRP